jgi:hypothetical protein
MNKSVLNGEKWCEVIFYKIVKEVIPITNQIKLFELFDYEVTIEEIEKVFPSERVIKIHKNVIGITYDYSKNSYRKLLTSIKGINLRQFIVYPNRYINFINNILKQESYIKRISFIEPLPSETFDFVDNYIQKINSTNDILMKDEYKSELFKELDWITQDISIDIQSISIQIMQDGFPFPTEIELYNNGVLLINTNNFKVLSDVLINVIEDQYV